jgi:hypothetical protein
MSKTPSKLLAGAEACRAMLISIKALADQEIAPQSESDAELKAAYAGQYVELDKAVSMALDQHGDNIGFRAALGSHLLTAATGSVLDLEKNSAEDLLSDGGYRAMPSEPAEDADDDAADVDFEDDGFRLERLLWLAEWIERARQMCDEIDTVSEYSEDLRNALKRHGLAWGEGRWSDEASAGLNILNVTAIRLARGLKAKGMALERQQKGGSRG